MSFLRRMLSADYRQALAAEAGGDYEEAARRYALSGDRDKVAEMHLARAEKAAARADEIAALRDAAHWAVAGTPVRARVARALGLALVGRARAEGIGTSRDRDALAEAASLLEEAGEHGSAGEACELLGDEEGAALAYERGGLVERMEQVLARQRQRAQTARRQRDALSDYQEALASGDREAARWALAEHLKIDPDAAHRRLLDELDARRLSAGFVSLRRAGESAALVICGGARVVLGRGVELPLPLLGPGLSRAHAEVHLDGTTVKLRDAGSRAGTFLENLPVAGEVELVGVGRIRLGEACELAFVARAGGLRLKVTRGPGRGAQLFAAPAGEIDLTDEGIPARIAFRDGRPHFLARGGLRLNRAPVGNDVELLRGDVLALPGVELEIL